MITVQNGGVNSHIQSLSKTICVEICPSAPKVRPKMFWEFPIFFLKSLKIVGNSENFGNSNDQINSHCLLQIAS